MFIRPFAALLFKQNTDRKQHTYREYLPSSPYISKAAYETENDNCRPENHLWGPRDYFKGNYYVNSTAHFASETGYHGCPSPESLKKFINALMANQIKVLFGEEFNDLETFSLASQLSQAEAVKFFIERFRSQKWRRTGLIWWNLIDGWPQISDAVVDYYYNKKIAYSFIKR